LHGNSYYASNERLVAPVLRHRRALRFGGFHFFAGPPALRGSIGAASGNI
jgi:hypothetical protein